MEQAGPGHDADSRGWVSTEAGAHLRGRRVRDTGPEVALRQAVHSLGLRFRLQRPVVGRCKPDLVFARRRLAVFVDGCFWHGCPQHGPKAFRGPNADRWRQKLRDNQARDHRNNAALAEAGWRVLRLWECEIRADVAAAARRVEQCAHES
ncbi:T/G mismatch-specific endonuclease [Micromonospora viridifaciens]|uniref:T/G mismatch-specific endonuclease n=1 Tax=Micromonospora viridifaciens TaxID=1881 RepID=A0A1C4ZPJ3_MICVI|nr:very short patch repair endonuclease [Micromonospora viridifaciens]SCF34701.1 T/G mismatch-specific endonuclease [Micromonospora viridifaciens]